MDRLSVPPLPDRPEIKPLPRSSWLTIALAGFAALAITVVMTFLTLGFFGPFVLLGLSIFGVIGLQYVVWGWWFERIYRSQSADDSAGSSQVGDK
jgi:hypothetical protein